MSENRHDLPPSPESKNCPTVIDGSAGVDPHVLARRSKTRATTVFRGYAFAIAATLMWSGNFIVARSFHDQLPPIGLAFWRWLTAACLLTPFTIGPAIRGWREIRTHIGYLSLTALIGITIVNPLVYAAGRTTNAVNLSLIAISTPIFMIILSRFVYGERIGAFKVFGMGIAIAGLLLLISGGSVHRLIHLEFAAGDLLMILSAFAFASYSVMTRMKPVGLPTMLFLLVIFSLGTAFMFPFYLWEYAISNPPVISWPLVLSIAYVALFASLFSYGLWNKAIESIGPSSAATIYYLIPVFSAISAHFILGEPTGPVEVMSMVLILLGIYVANTSRNPLSKGNIR